MTGMYKEQKALGQLLLGYAGNGFSASTSSYVPAYGNLVSLTVFTWKY